jgi:hypothetical protein
LNVKELNKENDDETKDDTTKDGELDPSQKTFF